MALAAAADVDADDTVQDEPTVWVGQFEPAIVDNLSSRETRPEAVRQIIIDQNDFFMRRGYGSWDWQTDRDLFHQNFRHRSVLPIRSPALPQEHGDVVAAAVWVHTGGPPGWDFVTESERYPPVSAAGWEGVLAPGLEEDDLLAWDSFEPGGYDWAWMRYYVRQDGAVRDIDPLLFSSRGFPRMVWWGDVTGDSRLDLVQWRRWSRRHEFESGETVTDSHWFLEFWRMGWEPRLLGAVLVAGGSLEQTRLPLYEFRPSREGADLAIELVPRLGIDLPLEGPTLRWNPDTGEVEAEEGRATGGAGWQLVPLETIQRSGTPHQVSNWPLQLPENLVNDERWMMTDIEPLAAPDELEKWQQELFERRLPVQLSHMFGDKPAAQDPADRFVARNADDSWWGNDWPPFRMIEPDLSDLWDRHPREAVEILVRRNMPEPLAGHYHVLVEPEAAADPWDGREGWLLRQLGPAMAHNGRSQGHELTAVGWRSGGAAWLLRLSGLWEGDAPSWSGAAPGHVGMMVATWEPAKARWLASASWWLDQHRTLTLTHNAPAGWPEVLVHEPGFGGNPPPPDYSRVWIADQEGGMRIYLPAQVSGGRAWTGPWSRRTTHAFVDQLITACLGQHPAHPVASLRADQDPETAWEQVRVWLDDSSPALTIDRLPPPPPALRVALVQAVAQANHQPGREWLQDLLDGLPEPDQAELALAEIVRRHEMAKEAWEQTAGQPDRFSSEASRDWREARIELGAAQADFLAHPWYRLRRVLPVALRQLDAWDDEAELQAWAGEEGAPGWGWARRRLRQLTAEQP